MRFLALALVLLIALIQNPLWFGKGGWLRVWELDRQIDAWYATLKVVEVAFDDEAAAFSNINTTEELRSAESGQRLPRE